MTNAVDTDGDERDYAIPVHRARGESPGSTRAKSRADIPLRISAVGAAAGLQVVEHLRHSADGRGVAHVGTSGASESGTGPLPCVTEFAVGVKQLPLLVVGQRPGRRLVSLRHS